MTRHIITLLICASASMPTIAADTATNAAPVTADAIIGESLKVFEAEGWSATDVAAAIKSLRGLYVRDNATKDGRARWHGKVVTTRIDTNTLTKTTIHEDGETFVDAAQIVTPAARVAASNAKLKVTISTNGIPARLAAARARRQAEIEQGVVTTNVTVTAGGR